MSDNSEIYLIEDLNHQIDGFKEHIAELKAEIERLKGENEACKNAVREFAAANAWIHFGDCRAFTETVVLKPHELDALARGILTLQTGE